MRHVDPPRSIHPAPEALVGGWRRFGRFGPVCEVIAVGQRDADGAPQATIRVLETGEVTDYPLASVIDDPTDV